MKFNDIKCSKHIKQKDSEITYSVITHTEYIYIYGLEIYQNDFQQNVPGNYLMGNFCFLFCAFSIFPNFL